MVDRNKTRLLCINCNICMNTFRRYPALAQKPRVSGILSSWVYPVIITEDDYVCEECKDLAVHQSLQQEVSDSSAAPSYKGHAQVCLICGRSLLKSRQKNKILTENPTDMHKSIVSVIEKKVAPRLITDSDNVCHACWLRVQREVRRMAAIDDTRSQENASPPEDIPPVPASIIQQSTSVNIDLPDYRRAANTACHCVFPNCSNTPLRTISDELRAIVLSNHNYYMPRLVRVCDKHKKSNSWDTLFKSENSIATFTVEQVQHVFSFVNAFNTRLDIATVYI